MGFFLSFPLRADTLSGLIKKNYLYKGRPYAEGEVLVKYKGDTTPSAEIRLGALSKKLSGLNIRKIKLKKGISVEEAIREFQADPLVEYAEPNYIVHINLTPNDPLFNQQGYLNRVDAPEAWDVTTGSPGVVVAVIDTGIDYNHPDIRGNIWINQDEIPNNGIDDDGNGRTDDIRGWDFITGDNGDNDPMDDMGHGTEVAGIIGAVGDNGIGIAGTAFDVQLMPLKALDFTGSGFVSDIIAAIEYAKQNGAHIVNCSFGFTGAFDPIFRDVIADAGDILFSCAAGNGGQDGIGDNNDITPEYPASFDNANIISVASTNGSDTLSSFSNYGLITVDLAAPGQGIVSGVPIGELVFIDHFDTLSWTVENGGTWGLESPDFISSSPVLSDSPGGQYANNTNNIVTSPSIDLTSRNACILDYDLRLDTEADKDFLITEISNDSGMTWTELDRLSGQINGLIRHSIDAFDGDPVMVRFRLQSNGGVAGDGAYIDNVRIICISSSAYNGSIEYVFGLAGTSFAAPLVSGTAALLKSRFTDLTALEMKLLIMNGVDVQTSLVGKTVTGGRLNIFQSFFPPPPENFTVARSGTEATLRWEDVPNEDTYVIERSAAGGAFAIITMLKANSTSYADTGLDPGTTYSWRIKAVNSIGESASVLASAAPSGGGGGGGCFIATAAFGSPLAKEVIALKRFRDDVLLRSAAGRMLVKVYYMLSPPLADLIRGHEGLKSATRAGLYPVIFVLKHPLEGLFFLFLLSGSLGFTLLKIVKYSAVKRRRDRSGFTLLEILIVVAILSTLAMLVAPKIMGRTDDAKVAEAQVQIRNLETGLKLFKLDNGFYPSTEQGLAALTEKPSSGKIPSRYREGGYLEQRKIPADPWGNPYVFIAPGLNGDYDLSSLGADGKEGGEGYDTDIKSWELR